jgi:hypothetical protein
MAIEYQVSVSMEGSLCRIMPLCAKARAWLEDNCQWEGSQVIGEGYVVDRRIAEPIIQEMRDEGFNIEE